MVVKKRGMKRQEEQTEVIKQPSGRYCKVDPTSGGRFSLHGVAWHGMAWQLQFVVSSSQFAVSVSVNAGRRS